MRQVDYLLYTPFIGLTDIGFRFFWVFFFFSIIFPGFGRAELVMKCAVMPQFQCSHAEVST